MFNRIERFEFYERAKKAFAIVATSERAQYANIILRKGVIKQC
jgi:L-fucose mutarotase